MVTLPIAFAGGVLRRLRPGDLAHFQAYRAIAELGRYQGWTPMPDAEAVEFLSKMHAKPLLEAGQWLQLGIAHAVSDELIGDIGIYLSGDNTGAEIGFTLAPHAQGRGVATAAVRAAVGLLLRNTEVREIQGVTDTRNDASVRLLERIGFTRVETRETQFRREPCSEHVYVLMRGDAPLS